MSILSNSGKRRLLARILIMFGITLAILHVASALSANASNPPPSWSRFFDLDNERNVPAVYTGLLLGCCAFVSLISIHIPSNLAERIRWAGLSGLFFYLAFDELLVIHESFAEPIRKTVSIADGSIFYHAWIIPGAIIALFIAVIAYFIKAGRRRISRLQKQVMLSVVILAGGVIALEAIGTQLYFSTLIYKLGPVLIEEMFEIGMISLILYKLSGNLTTGK